MSLPSIAGYTSCCGSSIVYGFFTNDPNNVAGYQLDSSGYGYAQDEKGENIPYSFADKFKEDMKREMGLKRSYMWSCILTHEQLENFKGAWKQILYDTGFQPVRRWYNHNHGENQLLYLFVLIADGKGKLQGDVTSPPKGWDKLSVNDAKPPSLIDSVKAAIKPKTKAA